MPLNKKRINAAKLYLILDAQVLKNEQLLTVLKDAVRFGVDVVQLRNKFGSAKEILFFCQKALIITRRYQVPFILNDRVDLAMIAGVDGVHLGQDDIPCGVARKMMGPKAIIGVSCQECPQVPKAKRDGADYVGFGSVFKTLTKPDRSPMDLTKLKSVLKNAQLPVFPIGGITRENLGSLKEIGVERIAVCRDILLAKDPGKSIKEVKKMLL